MNLSFFEDNVKDKEKLSNKESFWDMISVHGLENMNLLKGELNKVGKGFCFLEWNPSEYFITDIDKHIRVTTQDPMWYPEEVKKNPFHFIILVSKNSKEKQCYKVEDPKNVTIVEC